MPSAICISISTIYSWKIKNNCVDLSGLRIASIVGRMYLFVDGSLYKKQPFYFWHFHHINHNM